MTGSRALLTGGLAAMVAAGAAAPVGSPGQAEIVVRNESFSTLAVTVVGADGRETSIGQAPPDFTNTLYLPAGDTAVQVRFRARLRGNDDILFESDPISVRQGTRLRWTLPENVLELIRSRAAGAVAGVATPSGIG